MHLFEPAPGIRIHGLVGPNTSWLIEREGRSCLVDCHTKELGRWLAHRCLPSPELVLHTQVQPEHTREGGDLSGARIMVRAEERARASDRVTWERESRPIWEDPNAWGETMGRERFSIAGSVTMFPPERPLPVTQTFIVGEVIPFADLSLRVIALPGHDLMAVGFVLEQAGKALAVFTGDLYQYPGTLVNLYDLEYAYHRTTLDTIPALLRQVADLAPLHLPATGWGMADGSERARTLAMKIEAFLSALAWTSGTFTPQQQPVFPKQGRWSNVFANVWTMDNFGNSVLFIAEDGEALLIDPGPCDFGNARRCEDYLADLVAFEQHHGLKCVSLVLVTHIHGDHYDMTPLIRQRYPGVKVCAYDLVARVMDAPWDFPYPALLPWYHLGVEHVAVDEVLFPGTPFMWREVEIETLHLPGHTMAHAGYLFTWAGKRVACTGDVIQQCGDAAGLEWAMCNDSPAGEEDGMVYTYLQMTQRQVDINLGGHGSRFSNCTELYRESLARCRHALPFLAALVPNGDLAPATRRPFYPTFATR